MTSQHRRETTALRAYSFAIFMTSAVIISYMPLYFKSLGFSSTQIGFLYSLGPLISIVSNFMWGVTSDRMQTIKKVLLILLAAQTAMTLLLGLASSYGAVIVLLCAFNFFFYPIYPLTDSLSIVTTQMQGRSFIGIRVFGSIGFAVSALVFGFLIGKLGASYTIYVVFGLSLLSLALAFTVADKRASVKKMEFGGLWNILKQREVMMFLLCALLLAVAHRLNEAFLGLSIVMLGGSESLVGYAWMISAVSEIPMFFLLNAYGERFKELPLLALSAVLYVIRLLLAGLIQNPLWLMSTQLLHSITFAIFYFVAVRYLNRVIPEEYRATGMAIYTIVWSSLAGLLSGTIGGPLLQSYGKDIVYFVAACFAASACVGFTLLTWYSARSNRGLHSRP
ncbi:MFS transporter [Paenibacillus sp. UMB4589-SE434]|uniref:MFS transporter n=1 Tax=Paenibacillus sp. UMB4589-SE434 TaxID=3046314 RepID=UPI00254CCA70|nr:MFS transporter [Paenibacillus sp. UMB4589-SE434]MDK8182490.1 MFS transporter [Paenibacillus sp. UMB4589-SE434]